MTAKLPKPEPDDAEQYARFLEKARDLGADENGEAFKEVIKVALGGKKNGGKGRSAR